MANRSVRQHLQEHHSGLMKLHKEMAADHHEHAETHGAKSDLGKMHKLMADHHSQLAEHHQQMLAECAGMANKAMGMNDGDRIVPDNVQGVLRTFAPTAIPRYGAPDMSKVSVPEEFKALYSIDDD